MILKIKNQGFEREYGYYENSYLNERVCNLLKFKMAGLNKGVLISDELISETENFLERNMIKNAYDQCCPRCLKAHAIKKAIDLGLTQKEIDYLDNIFEGEVGHDGYYLDGEELIKVVEIL